MFAHLQATPHDTQEVALKLKRFLKMCNPWFGPAWCHYLEILILERGAKILNADENIVLSSGFWIEFKDWRYNVCFGGRMNVVQCRNKKTGEWESCCDDIALNSTNESFPPAIVRLAWKATGHISRCGICSRNHGNLCPHYSAYEPPDPLPKTTNLLT